MTELDMPKKFEYPTIKTTCSSCVFYNTNCAYGDSPCSKLGILASNKPCKRFLINPSVFDMNETKDVNDFVGGIQTKDLCKYALLLSREVKTRKLGFFFGQEVVVQVYRGDYVSNFARAYVISADKDYVYVHGKKGFRATLYHSSVLSLEQWDKKRASLLKRKKVKDPLFKSYTTFNPSKLPLLGTKTKAKKEPNKARSISMKD